MSVTPRVCDHESGIQTLADGNRKYQALLPQVPHDSQKAFMDRRESIPTTFASSAEQTRILELWRGLYADMKALVSGTGEE
jgi:hypothetical protein